MHLGLKVMLGMLTDRSEEAATLEGAIGKEITAIDFVDDALFLTFADESKIKIFDDGQTCCEERYMHTDDSLKYFLGARLMGIEIRGVPDIPHEYDVHEVQFLLIATSKGVFTMETHNVHNGYYGGFLVRVHAIE